MGWVSKHRPTEEKWQVQGHSTSLLGGRATVWFFWPVVWLSFSHFHVLLVQRRYGRTSGGSWKPIAQEKLRTFLSLRSQVELKGESDPCFDTFNDFSKMCEPFVGSPKPEGTGWGVRKTLHTVLRLFQIVPWWQNDMYFIYFWVHLLYFNWRIVDLWHEDSFRCTT